MPIEKVHAFVVPGPDLSAELVQRAKAAWFGAQGTVSPLASSGVVVRDGLGYVVLREADGRVVSAYRIRPDTMTLRRLKRLPKGL